MPRLRTLLAALSLATLIACDPTPSSLDLDPSFAKGGGAPVKVDATDPVSAPQDTTLDVRIFGSGFERGASAAFLLQGDEVPGVVTNRTRFVSETELVAEVTIELDADIALYDVEVSSSRGRRRGVGTELFAVVEKTNSGGQPEGDVVTSFADAPGDAIRGDGQGGYITVKKQQRITSEIKNGQHWLELRPRSKRGVCLTFPSEGPDAEIKSQGDWDDLVAVSSGAIGLGSTYCGQTTWHTRAHSDVGKLVEMDTDPETGIDDIQTAGGKMMLEEFGVSGAWEWRLMFDDGRTGMGDDQNGGIDRTKGLCIRYNQDGTWTLSTDPSLAASSENPAACDGVDDYVNLIRVTNDEQGAVFTHVARFRMPFTYTLIPLF